MTVNQDTKSWLVVAAVMAATASLGGCSNNNDDDNPVAPAVPPTTTGIVPDGTGASSSAFSSYVKALPTGDETSEPLKFNATFAAPAENTAEPDALT